MKNNLVEYVLLDWNFGDPGTYAPSEYALTVFASKLTSGLENHLCAPLHIIKGQMVKINTIQKLVDTVDAKFSSKLIGFDKI